ncbi:MAG: hypothetical protein ACI9IA_001561 [Enterobacterales bacterium]|jgi:hypothetical protein
MLDLFKSEFSRYKKAAFAFYLGQMMLWVIVSKASFILAPEVNKYLATFFLAVIPGFLFGILSMGLHSRKNNWTYLLHRALSAKQIHLALTLAALSVLFIGFVLPLLSVVFFLDLFTDNVVDIRHYLYSIHIFSLLTMAYFAGSFFILTPTKAAFIAIWSMTYLIIPVLNSASYDLIIDLIFVSALFFVNRGLFKINITEFTTNKLTIVLSALVLQPAIFFILLLTQTLYYHIPLTALGQHPGVDTDTQYSRGFYRSDSKDAFAQVVNASTHLEKNSLLRQLTLAEFVDLPRNGIPFAQKGQLFMKDRSYGLTDQANNEIWVFSHDQMLFEGHNISSGNIVGYLTTNGFKSLDSTIEDIDRFSSVPMSLTGRTILLPEKLYSVDFEEKTLVLKHQLPKDEYYIARPMPMFERMVIRTNKALHFIDQIDYEALDLEVTAEHIIKHPIDSELGLTFEITEVVDGFLILYASDHYHGFEIAGASINYIHHDGSQDFVASLDFPVGHLPPLIEYQNFMFSPIVMNILDGTIVTAAKIYDTYPQQYAYFWLQRYDISVMVFAISAMLLSALMTFLLASKMLMSHSNRLLWTLMNLFLSIPGFIAFMILNKWPEKNITNQDTTSLTKNKGAI